MASGGSTALVVALSAVGLSGCLGGPGLDPSDAASAGAALNPWEAGLATFTETPDIAVTASGEERRADVAPPGTRGYAAIDAVMQEFMAANEIPAGAVAVMRDGHLRYENGYGHRDEGEAEPTLPSALFRIASLTKPMTAAVVTTLVERGIVAWDQPVFCVPPEPRPDCVLPIEPHPARPVVDQRLAEIQVRHLVDHRVGWVRGSACDEPELYGKPVEIAELFGVPTPPPAWRLAQWVMGSPLDFDPGTDPGPGVDSYCNMGYILLGLVAEAATGVTLGALYDAYLVRPLDLSGDLEPGKSLPEDRNPREVHYPCEGGRDAPSVYEPGKLVCWADGAWDMEAGLAAGGLIATAEAVAAVYGAYSNDGSAWAPGAPGGEAHSGGMPGTKTFGYRFSDGGLGVSGELEFAIFFNKWKAVYPPSPEFYTAPSGFEEFQILVTALLGAYAAAEAAAPV